MATPIRSRLAGAARNYIVSALGIQSKSVWGGGPGGFLDFMGIRSGGGGDEITDSPGDYSRALQVESYVYKCVAVRTDAAAQPGLRVYERMSDGSRGDAKDHDAMALLQFTNPMMGQVRGTEELVGYTLGALDLHGRSAWQLATNAAGTRVTEIYFLPPSSFQPLRGTHGELAGLQMLGRDTVAPEQVVYLRTKNWTDPLSGTSKIEVLRDAINLRRYSVRSNKSFFQNSARPDVVVSGDFDNTEENMARIRRAWFRTFSGEHNRAPLFLGGNAKASLLSMSAKDAEWIQQQRLSGEEIAAVFKVPVIYLNNFERATYENISTAKLMLWHDGLMHDLDSMAAQLTRDFLWRFWPKDAGKVEFGFDYSQVDGLSEDVQRVTDRVEKVWTAITKDVELGVANPNQVRPIKAQLLEQLGLPAEGYGGDVEGGDATLDLYTKIPRGQHSVQEIINVMAARGENPELVEDVPGAENAGKNAQRAADRRATATPPPTPTNLERDKPAKPVPPPAKAPDLGQIVRLAIRDEFRASKRAKGPNPISVRDARLAKHHDAVVRQLKRYFGDLQQESLRTLRPEKVRRNPTNKAALPDPTTPLYNQDQAQQRLRAIIETAVELAASSAYEAAAEDYGLQVSWDSTNPLLGQFMGMRLDLIRGIDQTTQDALRQALMDAAEAGESIDGAAARITSVFADAIENRAVTIARTELIQAYGAASIQSYRDAGVDMVEVYDGIDFDEDCAARNGSIVSATEAQDMFASTHPNCTLAVAPVVPDIADLPAAFAASAPRGDAKQLGPGIRLIA